LTTRPGSVLNAERREPKACPAVRIAGRWNSDGRLLLARPCPTAAKARKPVIGMSDAYRDLHDDAYREWRNERADEFAEIQRRAFKAGFEAAANEAQSFHHIRQWLEEQRDEARTRYDESESPDNGAHAEYHAYVGVLVKLSEMGCETDPANE